ncbi:MAG: hypothetical protein HC886_07905 [Leptolyngbyaceae cyanobacterium SM1_1_3]|nr:hypothetical protein [Leptolyngbyaceae cyanobacterium SM1_1_3]
MMATYLPLRSFHTADQAIAQAGSPDPLAGLVCRYLFQKAIEPDLTEQ